MSEPLERLALALTEILRDLTGVLADALPADRAEIGELHAQLSYVMAVYLKATMNQGSPTKGRSRRKRTFEKGVP